MTFLLPYPQKQKKDRQREWERETDKCTANSYRYTETHKEKLECGEERQVRDGWMDGWRKRNKDITPPQPLLPSLPLHQPAPSPDLTTISPQQPHPLPQTSPHTHHTDANSTHFFLSFFLFLCSWCTEIPHTVIVLLGPSGLVLIVSVQENYSCMYIHFLVYKSSKWMY